MRRVAVLLAALAAAALLAGCLEGAPTGDATPTGDVAEDRVVDYGDLTPAQREAFAEALNGSARFSASIPESAGYGVRHNLEGADTFRDHYYLRKDGTYYRLRMSGPVLIGGAGVTVEPVDDPGNRTPVPLDDLGTEEAALLRDAIETDGTAARIGADVPENVSVGDVVTHRGDHYRVAQLSNRDFGYFELTAEESSPPTVTPAETPDPAEEEVLNYDSLSPEPKAAFDDARRASARFGSVLDAAGMDIRYGLTVAEPFRGHRYVRTNGSLYELHLDGPRTIDGIRVAVEPVDPGNRSTAPLENLSGTAALERAIETDGDALQVRGTPPVSTGDVVTHRGEHYRVTRVESEELRYIDVTAEEAP